MLLVENTMKAKCNKGLFIFIHNFRKKGTDIMHGYGIYVYNKGSKYEGQIINGTFNGKGRQIYYSGDYYEGDFKDDKRSGYGVYSWKDDVRRYEGQWMKNNRDGLGTETLSDGTIF